MYEAVLRQVLTDESERSANGSIATAVALRAITPQLDVLSGAERLLLTDWLDRVIDAG